MLERRRVVCIRFRNRVRNRKSGETGHLPLPSGTSWVTAGDLWLSEGSAPRDRRRLIADRDERAIMGSRDLIVRR